MWHGTWSACPPASRPLFASLSPRRFKHATIGTLILGHKLGKWSDASNALVFRRNV